MGYPSTNGFSLPKLLKMLKKIGYPSKYYKNLNYDNVLGGYFDFTLKIWCSFTAFRTSKFLFLMKKMKNFDKSQFQGWQTGICRVKVTEKQMQSFLFVLQSHMKNSSLRFDIYLITNFDLRSLKFLWSSKSCNF